MKLVQNLAGFPRLLLAGKPSKVDLGMLLVGILSAIASGVPFPLIGIIFGQLLDDFNSATCDAAGSSESDPDYQGSINDKILLIVYLAIAQFVLIYIHLTFWTLNGARLAQRLRETYLQNLLRQEPSFFDDLPPGEVASRLNGDIQTIRSGTAEKVGICLANFSFFVTAYIIAFIKDTKLAGMLVSLVPAYFLMSFIGSHYIEKYSGLISNHAATAASITSETLSNFVFSKVLKSSEHEGLKKATAVRIQSGVLYFIAYSANGLAFWEGSRQVADSLSDSTSGTTVGATFTVIFILVEASLLLSQVALFLHLFMAAVASFEKLRGDIERDPLINSTTASGQRLSQAEGGFEFNSVSFSYPSRPEITVLDRITLSIPANKHTAIVGLSGSGKSAIAGLVTRLYDPTEGQIFFDCQNLRDVNTRDLRGSLSLVQQEPSLLARSLLENITHGLINSSNPIHEHLKRGLLSSYLADLASSVRDGVDLVVAAEEKGAEFVKIINLVQNAAILADAHAFIAALQHGYGTIVGSSGRLICGGQKQRIALARALVKDPAVLILDKATASLDSRSEQYIQKAISNITSGRTIIMIAHRLSMITGADNIIVMHKGHIMEEGDPATLMEKDGAYANLIKLQTIGARLNKNESTTSIDSISKTDQALTTDRELEKSSLSLDSLERADKKQPAIIKAQVTKSLEEEPETPPKSLWALVRGYAPAVRPHLLIIVVALLGSSIIGGAFSGEAVISGTTGDFFGLMFFMLGIIKFFANIASWTGFGWISEKVVYTVRVLSFWSLLEQDLQWHQSKGRSPPLLLSYITRDGNALARLSGSIISMLFSITINLIAAIILTHIITWRIALLHVLGKFEERHKNAYTISVNIGVEAIMSIKTIASLSLEEDTLRTYQRSLRGPCKEMLAVTLQASNLINALAYWWGAKQILAGNYTQTQFLIMVFSLLVSALLWSQVFTLVPELSAARAAMARLLGLIKIGSDKMQGHVHPPAITAPSSEKGLEATVSTNFLPSIQPSASSVHLQNIHFSYPARPDIKVLNGLNIAIKPGKFCALVGPSGAGKSTIIPLIERLYTPQSGSILINGTDITKHRDVTFRDSIALVPQESVLFEGTIRFNISLGAKPGHTASMPKIIETCKLASIHYTITSLPDGYDTLCGPNGSQFSGGQQQRLSIARALIRKPKLLILDESTSALDAESGKLIQDGLEKAAKGITVIAIAHRLHTIRRADVIFLIDGGVRTDSGTHEELLVRSDSYRSNAMHQTVATQSGC
ncbi:ABC multidrug transporter SidT [Aspergillus crustosus]